MHTMQPEQGEALTETEVWGSSLLCVSKSAKSEGEGTTWSETLTISEIRTYGASS